MMRTLLSRRDAFSRIDGVASVEPSSTATSSHEVIVCLKIESRAAGRNLSSFRTGISMETAGLVMDMCEIEETSVAQTVSAVYASFH